MNEDQVRKAFELSMLFHTDLLGGDGEGAFILDKRGKYKDTEIELLYQGYRMARNRESGQLKRFSPNRNIAYGHMHELNQQLAVEKQEAVTELQVRTILKTVAGWPS